MATQDNKKRTLVTVDDTEDASEVAFCDLPEPYPITEIKPALKAFRRSNEAIYLYEESPTTTVESLERDGFLDLPQIIFATHGFLDDFDAGWMRAMKDEMLKVEDQTVILVGWKEGADLSLFRYKKVAANTQPVAIWLGEILQEIKKRRANINIWGVGHSFGAHLLGKAGRESKGFDRITGLDPAGPIFENSCDDVRLSKTDATMVDVIHTDGYDSTVLWFDHYGSIVPCGTVDFYPNFGYQQPGRNAFDIAGSHHSAIDYFIWSIPNPGKFATNQVLAGTPAYMKPVSKAKQVKETAEMGYHTLTHHSGLYYLETNESEPWAPVQVPVPKRRSRACIVL
ncbi:pancreatic lipase-related protein 2-like [Glandiceps talaboti]